jgi:hypothetical protein
MLDRPGLSQRGLSAARVFTSALFLALAPALLAPLPTPAHAQTPPPATDIILFTVVPHGDHVHARSLIRVTERNRYDNQPAFLDEDHLVFSAARDEDGVTDILRYSVLEDAIDAITRTPEAKYSPRPMPAGDAVSVVRVALDGVSQELVRVPLDGGEPEVILPGLVDIGYYAWIDETRVALFRLGDPPSLHIARTDTGEIEQVATGIGPVVQPIPGRAAASFVQPGADGRWLVRVWDAATGQIRDVTTTPGSQPDHVWLSSATLLAIDAGRVFRTAVSVLDASDVLDAPDVIDAPDVLGAPDVPDARYGASEPTGEPLAPRSRRPVSRVRIPCPPCSKPIGPPVGPCDSVGNSCPLRPLRVK